jgi:hypothetical protein
LKLISSIVAKLNYTEEVEAEDQMGVNAYDDENDDTDPDGMSTPLEQSVEAEYVGTQMVAKNPNAEIFYEERMSMIEDYDMEDDPYDIVKAHSVQLSKLTAMVESLQSKTEEKSSSAAKRSRQNKKEEGND